MEFQKKIHVRAVNTFPPDADISEVLNFVKAQRIPGEIVISLPGNNGVSAVIFRESEKVHRSED